MSLDQLTWNSAVVMSIGVGEVAEPSVSDLETKLKPRKSSWALALGGTPGESRGVREVNSLSKHAEVKTTVVNF